MLKALQQDRLCRQGQQAEWGEWPSSGPAGAACRAEGPDTPGVHSYYPGLCTLALHPPRFPLEPVTLFTLASLLRGEMQAGLGEVRYCGWVWDDYDQLSSTVGSYTANLCLSEPKASAWPEASAWVSWFSCLAWAELRLSRGFWHGCVWQWE